MTVGSEVGSGRRTIRGTGEVIRALAAGSVGNFVEWYDFAIYSYSVPVIATLFFPKGNASAAVISAFALYGVAFLARLLGGIFWGQPGRLDRPPQRAGGDRAPHGRWNNAHRLLADRRSGGFVCPGTARRSASGSGVLGAMVGQLFVALPWSFVVSVVVVTLVEIFPTRVRYSGASVGYNAAYAIFGGSAPLVASFLVVRTGSDISLAVYLVAVAVVVLLAVFALPEPRGLSPLQEGEERRESFATGARSS